MPEANSQGNVKRSKKEKLLIFKRFIQTYIPITSWLPNYKWKEYFWGDLMGGVTVGLLLVPQAIAFATIASASPLIGLHTSCFPVLIYCLFGTAKISSYGPTILSCLLIGEMVHNRKTVGYTYDQIITVITFIMGIQYLLAYIFHLSIITKLFTRAFTTAVISGCAVQVIFSTLKTILGIQVKPAEGLFTSIYNGYYTFRQISSTNFITLGISIAIFIVFIINTFVFKPLLAKRTTYLLPIELIVIVIITILSFTLELHRMGVEVVGIVPTGFPEFTVPEFQVAPPLLMNVSLIFLVSFTGAIIIAMILNPDLRPEQELLALGIANTFSSFIYSLPLSNSLVRTIIAKSCGIKTLLSSIISSIVILMVILFASPIFKPLPTCVLACIILYGLCLLLIRTTEEIPIIIKSGKENLFIWVVTLTTTSIISIEVGVGIGFLLTLRQFLAKVEDTNVPNQAATQEPETSSPANTRKV